MSLINDLRSIIGRIFEEHSSTNKPRSKWGDQQIACYRLLKKYTNQYYQKYCEFDHRNDKNSIKSNMEGQRWYKSQPMSSKLLIVNIIDQIKILDEISINKEHYKLLNLLVSFDKFKLSVDYYNNVNNIVYLEIHVTNTNKNKKNYIAYYIKGRNIDIDCKMKNRIDVPDMHDIYQLIDINENLIDSLTLLKLFLEIVLYYDQTETIGELKLKNDDNLTINEMLELC